MVKFLVIRFSSIGDIVLTTPVLRNLKKQLEGAEIHYLTKKQYLSVIEANPYIDKIWTYENNIVELVNTLKHEHFDYIIDLHNNIRSRNVKQKLGMLSFTVNKLNWEKWLMTNFKIDKLPRVHIVDRYMETLSAFDIENDEQGLDYFIPEQDEIDTNSLPEKFRNGYICFVIGAQHYTKKMPADKIALICSRLEMPKILIGGPEDKETGDQIISFCKENPDANDGMIYNSCGMFSINQSASIVKQASLVITHDTGFMHIAAAFKKKIISLWGNTIPEFGMYPYLADEASKLLEVKNLKCRPCTKIGFSKCPKKHFDCMNKQDIDGIVQLSNEL